MIIDGEELRMVCKDCGHRFKHVIGYGPVFPSISLRKRMLKEYPPVCPKCKSKNVKQRSFWDLFC